MAHALRSPALTPTFRNRRSTEVRQGHSSTAPFAAESLRRDK